MTTVEDLHGRIGKTMAGMALPDPFNNVGRWCDISHTFGYGIKGDRGWCVRQYMGRDDYCGCHLYLVTHAELTTGMVASMGRHGQCLHSVMGNLY